MERTLEPTLVSIINDQNEDLFLISKEIEDLKVSKSCWTGIWQIINK